MAKRWTAYKLNIKDLSIEKYDENQFLNHKNKKVRRVRIMGSVVSKFLRDDKNYGFLVIDDGTETIRVRSFEDNINLIEKSEIGDIIDIIGKIRKYEDEIYIIPEIIKKIEDPNWFILRKLELIKQNKGVNVDLNLKENKLKDDLKEDTHREKIVELIKKFDLGDGVEISKIKEEYKDSKKVDDIIKELLNEGELFEPMPEKIKLLE